MDAEFISNCGEVLHWTRVDGEPHQGGKRLAESSAFIGLVEETSLSSLIEGPTGKGRILIVDDDDSLRETLADLLECVGYCPVQAADMMEALMILRREPVIDALVSDLTMPGGDGITLIRLARGLRPDLPAILLTGCAEPVSAAVADGDFRVLRKPVKSERLIAQLELLVTKPLNA